MKRALAWVAVVLLAAGARPAAAQSVLGLGLTGQRVESGDVRATALGGSVQMVNDSLGVLQSNPALAVYIRKVTFGASQYMTSGKNRSTGVERRVADYEFSTFLIAFPIGDRVTMGGGYRGRFEPDWTFSTPMATVDGNEYAEVFRRDGGLFSFPVFVAGRLGDRVAVGAYASLETGQYESSWVIDFVSTTNADAFSRQARTLRGSSFGGGAVLGPLAGVTLGVNYQGKVDYDTDVVVTNTNDGANASYSETTHLPEKWALSMNLRATATTSIHLGGSFSPFTEFSGLSFPSKRMSDEIVFAAGVEKERLLGSRPLRAGISWEQMAYLLPENEHVRRFAATVGTGLPLGGGRAKIDLALEYSLAGDVNRNLYEEQSWRLYVGIAGSESWHRKREDYR